MWIRYDFTDAENPDMCVIYDYPIFRKYFYIDLKEALAATSEAPESNKLITDAVSGVEKIFDSEYINGLTDKIINPSLRERKHHKENNLHHGNSRQRRSCKLRKGHCRHIH